MRWLLTIFIAILICHPLAAQKDDYQRSLAAYRQLKTDSATLYIDRAIVQFRSSGKTDSLVFAYEHKADMFWREQGIPQGMAVIDTALALAKKLPPSHLANIAVLNKKAQILVHNMEAAKAKKYFSIALQHVLPTVAANDRYADLYNNVSWLHLELQDFPAALDYAEKAKNILETIYGKDARKLVSIYQSLCLITHDAGNFQQSEKYGLEMYRLAKLNLSPNHPSMGLMHNDLGTLYESMHHYEEALFHRQRMVDIIQKDYLKNKNPQLLAIAYNNMGNLYEIIGEFYLANEYFEKARKLHEINYGANSAGIVRPLTHLANAKRSIGDYAEAGRLYEQAYRLQKEHAGDDWLNLAYVEAQYGDLFFDRKLYDDCARLYLRALDNYRKAGVTGTNIVQNTRSTLGETYARTNRTNEALLLLTQVEAAYRKTYPSGHIVIAGQLNRISETYLLAGKLTEAWNYSDSVFAELLQVRRLPAGIWLARLPYNYHIIRYLKNRMAILEAQYKQSGKINYLIEMLQLSDEYGEYIERGLPALRTQTSLIDIASQNKSIYNQAIESCWELYQKENKQGYLEKAFALAERSKALLLRLAANNLMVDVNSKTKDPAARRDLYWRNRISALNAGYMNADNKSDSLLTLLTASMEQYRLYQDSMLQKQDPQMKMKYRLQPFSLQEIRQQLLNNRQTLLQYAVTDNYVFVFLLNNATFKVQRLPKTVLEDVKQLEQLHDLSAATFMQPAYRLYQHLIAPMKADFSSDRLFIVPDADLFYLNFELLISSRKNTGFDKMDYLIRQYNISYLLSAASAIQFKAASHPASDKALLLAPVFTDEMKNAYRKGMPDSVVTDERYFTLLRQPFMLLAAKEISKYVKHDFFSGPQALESLFKNTAPGYRVLHLGTHAEINNSSPLQSRFFFAKPAAADSADTDDGYLHAYEIYSMQLKAELAVLTACESGAGVLKQGEGVVSLAHSFMHAGCPAVIMSLWKIDEKTSAGIITQFYKYLSDGESKSEALRGAKLNYLEKNDPELSHPYYWAGLNLIGDDTAVYDKTSYTWLLWVLGALILIWGCSKLLRSA